MIIPTVKKEVNLCGTKFFFFLKKIDSNDCSYHSCENEAESKMVMKYLNELNNCTTNSGNRVFLNDVFCPKSDVFYI